VHRVIWRVGSGEAIAFWASRLAEEGVPSEEVHGALRFSDPEGLAHELAVSDRDDAPLIADHPEVPAERALQGFDAVRAYSANPSASRRLLEEGLGLTPLGDASWEARGEQRGGLVSYDEPPAEQGRPGAGTVHHVAWASTMDDHPAWRERALQGGARPTEVIDRFWFRSIYFTEPSGVLFEIASMGPGFATDEDPEHLGEKLVLPPRFEPMRERIEATLTPLATRRG